ncbi:MAG: matrixin family metalloprotease, partial [Microvirga sp.]
MPDYKAILTGQSWNATPTLSGPQKPVFLTYAFPSPAIFSWMDEEGFTGADRQAARKALKMWGDASGITFLEVSGQDAEIRFLWKEADDSVSAWAEFPNLQPTGAGLVRDADGGEVNLNSFYRETINANAPFKLYLLLHEIGHALGLKHPFHTSPHNTQLLGE